MDRLDTAISELRIEIEKLKSELEIKEARLAALTQACELRPTLIHNSRIARTNVASTIETNAVLKKRHQPKGRVPGSINLEWRGFLEEFVKSGNSGVTTSEFIERAAQRFALGGSSARQRMRQYLAAGYLDLRDDLLYVSESAIYRFRLRVQKR